MTGFRCFFFSRVEKPLSGPLWGSLGGETPKSLFIRSFEKGVADGGGWREEILPVPQIQASFLHF